MPLPRKDGDRRAIHNGERRDREQHRRNRGEREGEENRCHPWRNAAHGNADSPTGRISGEMPLRLAAAARY
jgi:hypothetical protein